MPENDAAEEAKALYQLEIRLCMRLLMSWEEVRMRLPYLSFESCFNLQFNHSQLRERLTTVNNKQQRIEFNLCGAANQNLIIYPIGN